jgi:hypothetical protein
MKPSRRRLAVLPLVTLSLSPLFLLLPDSQHAAELAPAAPRAAPVRGVRVHHELVIPSTVVRETLASPPSRSASTAPPPRREPAIRAARRSAPRDTSLLTKARRLLVGTGRHRPEPFPTPVR